MQREVSASAGARLPERVAASRGARRIRCSSAPHSAYNPPHARPDDGLPADAVDASSAAPNRSAGRREIVSRLADKSIQPLHLRRLRRTRAPPGRAPCSTSGITPGDRVATLGWNHGPHLEAYFGIPLAGGVLHTLNLRLHPDELAYIVNHAEDRAVLVDESLLPLWEQVRAAGQRARRRSSSARRKPVAERRILEYEALIAQVAARARSAGSRRKRDAVAMCYTTGTTGNPKGVLYSHRALDAAHASACRSTTAWASAKHDVDAAGRADVPRQRVGHAVCRASMVGAKLVMPGPHLDPASLVDLFHTRARDAHRRRADDLDGRAAVPRRQPGQVRSVDASARCTSAAPRCRRR